MYFALLVQISLTSLSHEEVKYTRRLFQQSTAKLYFNAMIYACAFDPTFKINPCFCVGWLVSGKNIFDEHRFCVKIKCHFCILDISCVFMTKHWPQYYSTDKLVSAVLQFSFKKILLENCIWSIIHCCCNHLSLFMLLVMDPCIWSGF